MSQMEVTLHTLSKMELEVIEEPQDDMAEPISIFHHVSLKVLLLTRIVSTHLYVSDHSQDSLDGPTRKIIILRKLYH